TRASSAVSVVGTCQRIGVGMRPSDHKPIAESIPAAGRGPHLRDQLSSRISAVERLREPGIIQRQAP
ncbi:MAG TPA: hypothetical protein VEL51_01190, partial [Vicinamibacterales bacterium]|nr:hypothetical protein [Vicinamibacterales bacterium]